MQLPQPPHGACRRRKPGKRDWKVLSCLRKEEEVASAEEETLPGCGACADSGGWGPQGPLGAGSLHHSPPRHPCLWALVPRQPEAASLPVHFLHPTETQSPSCCAHKPLFWPPGLRRGPATKLQNIIKGFLGQSTSSHKQPSDPTEVANPLGTHHSPDPHSTDSSALRGSSDVLMSAKCGTRRLTSPRAPSVLRLCSGSQR